MATIRIADAAHPRDALPPTRSRDVVDPSVGDGVFRTRSLATSDTADAHDDIYNIRSRSKPAPADARGSRPDGARAEDDDPGLGRPDDFKQKQVPADPRG